MSRDLKALALEINCPLLCLSQLNRECEREKRMPRLSDLRDSGSIEQDADLAIFLEWPHWEAGYKNADGTPNKGLRRIDVAKQRNGPTSWFDVIWQREFQQFHNLEYVRAREESYGN
jgi:replicative DNA helicase